ncbi:diacylglycerol kinase family protein [Saccharomonospora sp. NPDC006951]
MSDRVGTARPPAWRRVNAAVAIATALAAIGVAIAVVAGSPVQVAIAVVLLAVAMSGSWAALVNRGFRRALACSVAVVTLLSLAVLPELRTYLVLLVVGGLCLVSTAAARVALAGERGSPHPGTRVPPAAKGVLLLNPRSGGGKVERFRLDPTARQRGITTVVMGAGDDVRALAERAVADGADVLGMAGGDGSQAIVADIARRHGVAFVCVPAGTRNHFALDLGLDRDDVPSSLEAFGPAIERRVDLAAVNGRVFVNNASLGVYAALVRSPGYREAKFATLARTLPDLLGPRAPCPDLRFTGPGGAEGQPADIVVVSNGAYHLDHVYGFGSRERLDAGTLGVVTISIDRTADVPALVSAELAGRLRDFRGYRAWSATEFVVDSGQALVDVGIDGEALRMPPPLRFTILPSALRVRVPPATAPAAGTTMAALGLPHTARALALVLAGHPSR